MPGQTHRPARSASLLLRSVLGTGALPALITLVTVAATQVRLGAQERSIAADTARMASVWLAQRLPGVQEDRRADLLRNAEARLGASIGLFDRSCAALAQTRLGGLTPQEVQRLAAAQVTNAVLKGRYHIAAAAPVYLPEGRSTVIVASDRYGNELSRLSSSTAILAIGAVFVALGLALGWVHGRELGAVFNRLGAYVATIAARERPDRSRASGLVATRETSGLNRAVCELDFRYKGEIALYTDALDEVEAVDKLRTRFLTAVAGELRTPLVAIDRQAEHLLAGQWGPLSHPQTEDVAIVRRATQRLLDLVNDIRDFSALIAGGIEYDEHPVDLVEVAAEVAETARGQLGKKRIDIVFTPPDTAIRVPGSRRRLWQVMTNLVANGIKFTERGEVRIAVSEDEEGNAIIEVSDTGVGISHGDHEAIFDPFHQQGERSKRRKGTGLGLAISKRLVDLHSGTIRVGSIMGQGSTFTVTLPLDK